MPTILLLWGTLFKTKTLEVTHANALCGMQQWLLAHTKIVHAHCSTFQLIRFKKTALAYIEMLRQSDCEWIENGMDLYSLGFYT